MAYFGNSPVSASYLTDYFSGNGSTVAFTLSRAPVSASSVVITISGVKQAASTYGVSGTTLTFSAAPPTGTNNIEVLHLGVQPDTVVQPSYRTITEFTATAGQTTFSPASYTVGYIDVYRNGVKLGTADFTATNGTSVVLANACAAGDYVRFEGFLITSFNNAIPNTNGAVGSSLLATGAAVANIGNAGITQSMLANNVTSTGPVLSVTSSNQMSVSSSTWTKIQFNNANTTTGGVWGGSSGVYTWAPTTAGWYLCTLNVNLSSAAPCVIAIRRNVSEEFGTIGWNSINTTGQSTSSLIYLNGTTDFISGWVYSSGVSNTLTQYFWQNQLNAVLVRAA